MRTLIAVFLAVLTSACGNSGTTQPKQIFDGWHQAETYALVDQYGNAVLDRDGQPSFAWRVTNYSISLVGMQLGVSKTIDAYAPYGGICTCTALFTGTVHAGTYSISACSGNTSNCANLNSAGTYTQGNDTAVNYSRPLVLNNGTTNVYYW